MPVYETWSEQCAHVSDGLTTVKIDSLWCEKDGGDAAVGDVLLLPVAFPASMVEHMPGDSVPRVVDAYEKKD
jgi:hypothetical protein